MSLLGLRSLGVVLVALALAFFPPFYPVVVEPVLTHVTVLWTGRSLEGLRPETLASTLTTLELHERALVLELEQVGGVEQEVLKGQLHQVKRQQAQVQQALWWHGLTPPNLVGFGLGLLGLGLLSQTWGRRMRPNRGEEAWEERHLGPDWGERSSGAHVSGAHVSEELTQQAQQALGPELAWQVRLPTSREQQQGAPPRTEPGPSDKGVVPVGGLVGVGTGEQRGVPVFFDPSVGRSLEEVMPRVDSDGLPVDLDFSSFDPEALMARLEAKPETLEWSSLTHRLPEGESLSVLLEQLLLSGQELAVLGVLSRWLAQQPEGSVRLGLSKERLEGWAKTGQGEVRILSGPREAYQRAVLGWVKSLELDVLPQVFVVMTPTGVQVQRLQLGEQGLELSIVRQQAVKWTP